jgi:hypothetical protein
MECKSKIKKNIYLFNLLVRKMKDDWVDLEIPEVDITLLEKGQAFPKYGSDKMLFFLKSEAPMNNQGKSFPQMVRPLNSLIDLMLKNGKISSDAEKKWKECLKENREIFNLAEPKYFSKFPIRPETIFLRTNGIKEVSGLELDYYCIYLGISTHQFNKDFASEYPNEQVEVSTLPDTFNPPIQPNEQEEVSTLPDTFNPPIQPNEQEDVSTLSGTVNPSIQPKKPWKPWWAISFWKKWLWLFAITISLIMGCFLGSHFSPKKQLMSSATEIKNNWTLKGNYNYKVTPKANHPYYWTNPETKKTVKIETIEGYVGINSDSTTPMYGARRCMTYWDNNIVKVDTTHVPTLSFPFFCFDPKLKRFSYQFNADNAEVTTGIGIIDSGVEENATTMIGKLFYSIEPLDDRPPQIQPQATIIFTKK